MQIQETGKRNERCQVNENKLGIKKFSYLKREEERISKQKAISFWMRKEYKQIDFSNIQSLVQIHKILFEDIYDWAGKLREVNLSKDGFQFSNITYLKENMKRIDALPQRTFDEIINKYVEINILHLFRDGNGRSGRLWLNCLLLLELHIIIDWSELERERYMCLMKQSVKDSKPLIDALKIIAKTDVYSSEIFFESLDFSYYYEKQYEYSSSELAEEIEKCSL